MCKSFKEDEVPVEFKKVSRQLNKYLNPSKNHIKQQEVDALMERNSARATPVESKPAVPTLSLGVGIGMVEKVSDFRTN